MKNKINFLSLLSTLLTLSVQGQTIQYLSLNTNATFSSKTINTSLSVGKVDGAVSVSPTGSAVYTIPMQVPSGTREMAPNIALVYNSHGSNGIMATTSNMFMK